MEVEFTTCSVFLFESPFSQASVSLLAGRREEQQLLDTWWVGGLLDLSYRFGCIPSHRSLRELFWDTGFAHQQTQCKGPDLQEFPSLQLVDDFVQNVSL